MTTQPKINYSLEEYLELDRKSESRLEFWNGEIFDMSGVSPTHDRIESNLHFYLRVRLQGRNCRAFMSNMRVKVSSFPPYRYSDLSALCEEPQYEKIGGVEALTNPSLLIEILSESTEAYDRGDKFTHYKSIPSFREYLLIAQHRPHISHFAKQEDGSWKYMDYNDLTDVVKLVSLNCELPLLEVFENVEFDPSARLPHPVFEEER